MADSKHKEWSPEEVEATVQAYVDMLVLELAGQPFNKADRRRNLQLRLDDRSEGAIERKHQNISAILIELGLPYIDGYKPLGNYQALLREVVEDRIDRSDELVALVAREIQQPVEAPTFDDILATLVDPPKPTDRRKGLYLSERKRPRPRVNYLLQEVANRQLGLAGEQFAIDFERARLTAADRESLAARVEHVARTRGDHLGFDVLSFDGDGRERLIEVKTTRFGAYTPFFVTANELQVSQHEGPAYHLYRLYSFKRAPQLFMKAGALEKAFDLDPAQYLARIS